MSENKIEILIDKIESVDPKVLKLDPKNRNKHSEAQIDRLIELIKNHGWRQPIIVSTLDGYVKAGNGRLLAALKMKLARVPVSYQSFRDDMTSYSFSVSDNAIAAWAELDLPQINSDIGDYGPELNVDMLGIQNFSVTPEEHENTETKTELTALEENLLNEAWAQWVSEQTVVLAILQKQEIFAQSLTPGALKIYFLRSLFLKERFPRFVTTARQYHRMLCAGKGKTRLLDYLESVVSHSSRANGIRCVMEEKPDMFRLVNTGMPMGAIKALSDFPAELAKNLYDEFGNKGRILDPCHGWGGRYIGFLLSEASEYVGFDPAPLTHQGLKNISSDLSQYHDKKGDFICGPFEDSNLENHSFDFALTSPPYFDVEQYIGGEQAYIKYKTYQEFIDGFYTSLFLKTHNALKNNSCFALQIGTQKYDLDKQALRIAKAVGFKYLDSRETSMKTRKWQPSGLDDNTKEIILIFNKGA